MNKKRVLFILQLPPPVHGVSVMNDIIRKSERINTYFDCDYINLATASSIHDIQKSSFRKYLLTIAIIFKTVTKLCSHRYAAVYITIFPYGFAFVKDSIIVLITKLFGYKPHVHLHTFGFRERASSSKFKFRYYRRVFRNTIPICLSSRLLPDIATFFRGSVCILPNGVPATNFRNDYRGDQQPPVILYLSNLIRAKGVFLLVEAARILRQRGYSFNVRVAGPEGNVSYKELEALIKSHDLDKVITLLGPKFGEDKKAEFQNATVFAFPSYNDSFGLVLIEAMQYGVPCVSTGVNAIPDIIGSGRGVLMSEITAESLADSLVFLLDNPGERKRISLSGFSYFHDNFTVTVFEERLLQILDGRPQKVDNSLAVKAA